MQVINPTPSAGANIAEAIGQGLGSGLQQLANARMQHVTEQKEAMKRERGLVSSGIFDTKEAKWASQLPDKLLDTVIKQKLQARSMEAFGQAFQGPSTNNTAPNAGTNATGFGSGGSGVGALSGLGSGNAGNANVAPSTYNPVQANYAAMNPQQAAIVAQMNETRRRDAEKLDLKKTELGLKERGVAAREEQAAIRREKLTKEERMDWKKVLDASAKKAEVAEKLSVDYKTLKKLALKGDIRSPGWTEFFDRFNISATGRSTTTQLVDKITNQLVADKSKDYGSSGNVFLEQVQQKSNPSILNDPQTIYALSEFGDADQEFEISKTKEENKYYKEHKDEIIPPEMDLEINERLAGARDKRMQRINNALNTLYAFNGTQFVGDPGVKIPHLPRIAKENEGKFFFDRAAKKRYTQRGMKYTVRPMTKEELLGESKNA